MQLNDTSMFALGPQSRHELWQRVMLVAVTMKRRRALRICRRCRRVSRSATFAELGATAREAASRIRARLKRLPRTRWRVAPLVMFAIELLEFQRRRTR